MVSEEIKRKVDKLDKSLDKALWTLIYMNFTLFFFVGLLLGMLVMAQIFLK